MRYLRGFARFLSSFFWGFIVGHVARRYKISLLKGRAIFLVHPRVIEDIYLNFPFLKPLGLGFTRWLLPRLPPAVIGPVIAVNGQVRGRTFFCPWTVEMMLANPDKARQALKEAAQTARNLGAEWLATGALSAAMTTMGRDVRIDGLTVTTGHSATIILGAQILLTALSNLGLEDLSKVSVGVIGAGGNIGGALALRLAGKVGRVVLLDQSKASVRRRMERVARALRESGTAVSMHTVDEGYASVLKGCVVVFTATSNPKPFLLAEDLKRAGVVVVVDDSQPASISKEEAKKFPGLVLPVLAHTPGVDTHFCFQEGVGEEINYTCLAELLALSMNGTKEGVVGPVTSEAVAFVAKELHKAEYDRVVLQSLGRSVTSTDWDRVRSILSSQPTPTSIEVVTKNLSGVGKINSTASPV